MNKHTRFTYTGFLSSPIPKPEERKEYIQPTPTYYEPTSSSSYTTLPPSPWAAPSLGISPFLSQNVFTSQSQQQTQQVQQQRQRLLQPQAQIPLQQQHQQHQQHQQQHHQQQQHQQQQHQHQHQHPQTLLPQPRNQQPVARTRGRRVSNIPSNGTRMFACKNEGCGKVFKRSEHLKRHIRSIHTMEKPFKCPYQNCNKCFSRSDNLNQHIRIHRHCNKSTNSSSSSSPHHPDTARSSFSF